MKAALDDVSVIVLAGGRGTRIQSIHPETPKPMVPVLGQPFLYWLTLWLSRHGLRHFVYSTGYRAEQIEAFAQAGMTGLDLSCIREAQPLGTGGGLLNCLQACRDWSLVVNGDGLVMGGLSDLLGLRGGGRDAGMLGVDVEDASRYGSLSVDPGGRLVGFREKAPGRGLVNGGVYLFSKAALQSVARPGPCSIETDLFPALLTQGARIDVVKTNAAFIDIGTPETLAAAEAFVRTHVLVR